MIGFLRGKLVMLASPEIIIDVGGVGYLVKPTALVMKDLPPLGEEIVLFTYLHLRDDAVELYGFKDREQLDVFKILLKVSGIGPSTAMAVLSTLEVHEIRRAINQSDIKTLCLVSGVGKKTAQRLILELKGELPQEEELENNEDQARKEDLFAALESLGYSRRETSDVVEKVTDDCEEDDLSQLLRRALKFMAKE